MVSTFQEEEQFEKALLAIQAEESRSPTDLNLSARKTKPMSIANFKAKALGRKDESAADLPAREKDILKGRRLLTARMSKLSIKEHAVGDDGNCLFRAISHQLHNTEEYHPWFRAECVKQLRENREQYALNYFEGNYHFDSYCHATSFLGYWGDEIALKALADRFLVVVYVLLSTPGNCYLRYSPDEDAMQTWGARRENLKIIFLSYLAPIHYNSLTCVDSVRLQDALDSANNSFSNSPPSGPSSSFSYLEKEG